MPLQLLKETKCFEGWVKRFKHFSSATKTEMVFSVFLPRIAENETVPVLYYLSGLTCTDENFMSKSGAQRIAALEGIALVAPDTSPRNCGIEGEDESYDFGSGAGFYVNATMPKWKDNYNMYDYVTQELQVLVEAELPVDKVKKAVFGHSMGGHGALICALKNPGMFKSVSAFSPICNPVNCPWGIKAFSGYLGEDKAAWAEYDATELCKVYKGPGLPIKIDVGSDDEFLQEGQLLPLNLVRASVLNVALDVNLTMYPEYDHSYYFIASYVEEHIKFHAHYLK